MTDKDNALLLRDNQGDVFFLGRDDLMNYRLTGDLADAAHAALDQADSDQVEGFAFEPRGQGPRPLVHATEFRSLVYAPVMRGYNYANVTADAFTIPTPPAPRS